MTNEGEKKGSRGGRGLSKEREDVGREKEKKRNRGSS